MDARLGKIENSEAYIEIEIDAEMLEQGMEKAYRKVVKQVTVPGFRRGRVPRQLLEAHFGKEILYEDTLEFVVPDAYDQAIEKLKIEPLAQPEFDQIGEIQEGEPLTLNVRVAVKPDVKLGELEGIKVSIPKVEVTEKDVDQRLEDMRSRYARLIEKTDEAAASGDTVKIDFEGSIDGVLFEGGTGTDYSLELGSHSFIPGFEEQLVGAHTGDTVEVKVTFPQEYHAEDLAGKDAVFKTTVNKIETRELRPLDDAFVQEVSEFETVAELREDLKKKLEEIAQQRKQEMINDEVISEALSLCEVPVAKAVINMQVSAMLKQFEQRIATQGIKLEQYFQLTNTSEEDFRQDMSPEAEHKVKVDFMLEKIIEEKGIEVTDEEIDNKITEVAASMKVDADQARQNLAGVMDNITYGLKLDKAVKYLVDHAEIVENDNTDSSEQNDSSEELETPEKE
ncbi:MAG TPA: trigger factor [Syntrophomonadaceae bacterium]|nr:trigger factor [Syntrophomonadaceae bacterium]